MKKIAETNLYIISIDAKKNRLYQEVRGRWLVPTIGYHYEDDIDRALRLLKPGFTVLNNALKVESLMSPEWRNIAEKIRERIVQSGMKASAEVLPEIVEAVDGALTVLVDGGVRSGTDVLKMLALGAEAVLIGRPLTVGAVGGAAGVALVLQQMAAELQAAMIMTGTASVEDVAEDILW